MAKEVEITDITKISHSHAILHRILSCHFLGSSTEFITREQALMQCIVALHEENIEQRRVIAKYSEKYGYDDFEINLRVKP
jgi:hypothetical protein